MAKGDCVCADAELYVHKVSTRTLVNFLAFVCGVSYVLKSGTEYTRTAVAKSARFATYLRSPFLSHRLGQSHHTGLCKTVVRLSCVSVRAARTANVDNAPVLAVFHSEIRRGFAYQSERRRVVYGDHGVPLLVAHFMNHPVPSVPCVVDDEVDFAAAKLGRLLDQHGKVARVGHIARHADGGVGRRGIDRRGDRVGLGAVDVAHYDFGAFVGEKAGAFGTDALAGSRNLHVERSGQYLSHLLACENTGVASAEEDKEGNWGLE